MKQRIKTTCMAACFAALLCAGRLSAQENIVVAQKKTVLDRDTTVVIKTYNENKLYIGEFGIRYLPTFTSLSLGNSKGDVVNGNATISSGFGIMLGYNFSKNAGMQVEINYDQVSQKYKDGNMDRQVKINYINVPLLLAINTDKTNPVVFGLVAGPQFGINVGSSFEGNGGNNSDTLHATLAVKQGDVGLAYGAGFEIALNPERNIRLDFGFRGVYGLVDMSGKQTGDNSYNILLKGSRKSNGGYAGITFLF